MSRKRNETRQNLWQCPECGKVVDYGNSEPSVGRTTCTATGKTVQMIKVGGASVTVTPVNEHEAIMGGDADAMISFIEAQADAWADDAELTGCIKNLVSVGRLNRSVPNSILEKFIARQEAMIHAFMLQCFIEGFIRGDENRANVERIK